MEDEIKKVLIRVVLIVCIMMVFSAAGFLIYSNLAPKYTEVDRKIFEQSKSYVKGKIQDLAKYYKEYSEDKTEPGRNIIKNIVSIQFSDFDSENIKNKVLKDFMIECRGF